PRLCDRGRGGGRREHGAAERLRRQSAACDRSGFVRDVRGRVGLGVRSLVVRPYDPTGKREWDELVRRARAPHFFFQRDYVEYHADRFADASLLVYEGGRVLAALPANRAEDAVVSHGGLTFGGFVTDRA